MPDIKAQKTTYRQNLKTLLSSLPQSKFLSGGQIVAKHVELWLKKTFGEKQIRAAYFKSMSHEISTEALEQVLIKQNALRVLPIIEQEKLLFAELGAFSIFDPAKLDVIFMPGRGFDKMGHRLGRGKGHFDQALSLLPKKRPILVGLALDEQVLEFIPNEAHDIGVDYICTPLLGMMATNQRD